MLKTILFGLLLLSTIPTIAQDCPIPDVKTVKKSDPVPLCLVAAKVKQALDDYNADPASAGSALPPLAEASFDFKVARSTSAGFKVSFFIFTLGSTREADSVDDVTFTYKVPSKKGLGARAITPDFSKQLVETIKAAAQQIKQTDSIGKATFNSLTVDLAYCVKWDFSGGATLPIQLVTAGGNFDRSKSTTQSVHLVFAKTGDK